MCMKIFCALALFVAGVMQLQLVAPAHADCHRPAVRVRNVYVPAVRAVHANYAPYVANVAVVKQAVAYYPQYFYSVGDGYQQAILADAIAYRVQQGLLAQAQQAYSPAYLPRYQQQQPAVDVSQEYQPAQPIQLQKPQQACESCQQSAQPQQAQGVQVQGALNPALNAAVQKHCIACHAGQNGVDLSNLSQVAPADRGACYAAVKYGAMPKGHPKLPVAVQNMFRAWSQSK